jgi:hypothetical protein
VAEPRRPPLTLPRALRNRLAELILDALHDAAARRTLGTLASAETARERLAAADRRHAAVFAARAARAVAALARRPLSGEGRDLAVALADAGALFDTGLYFEVHELLEPYWAAASGAARDALQGLIQVAVGYQHLVNGNVTGARVLLGEGSARIAGRSLVGLELTRFAGAVRATIAQVGNGDRFDWTLVPPFPPETRP